MSVVRHATIDTDLLSLYHEHQWFSLRDQMQAQEIYRGAIACAFNEFPRCHDHLDPILTSSAHSKEAYQAHDLLAWTYIRRGMFHSALPHIEAMLAMNPREAGIQGIHTLLFRLSQYPGQTTPRHQPSVLPCTMVEGNMFVPVTVNGTAANFMIDSGATLSMITQSEAERLKLHIEEIGPNAAKLYGATGAGTSFRVTVASNLNIGNLQLSNVSFLVLNDDQFQFPKNYAGALGLTVLIALETLCWRADDTLSLGFPSSPRKMLRANVCFDGPEILAEAEFEGDKLPFVLDTGNGMTALGPAFANKFTKLVSTVGRKSSLLLSGVSGSAEMESVCLPTVTLRIKEVPAKLHDVHVLLQPTTPNSSWLFGRLGIDLLKQAGGFILDFHSMQLSIGGAA